MGGITTGVGIFSGIDSASLIEQLIAAQSRPLILAQSRVIDLNQQQAAYLDINSRLSAFKTAAASFRVNNVFNASSATASNESIFTASATNSAVPGTYSFIVDQLVSSQQLLSRGFADSDTSAIGLDSLTFESPAARVDTDTALADLNSGEGITRGTITVNGTEVDLSRAATVNDVLTALNDVSGVNAYVDNDKFVIEGVTELDEEAGAGILSSLGLSAYSGVETDITGTSVYSLTGTTALNALNDGRGVEIYDATGVTVYDFSISIDGEDAVQIRLGEIQENVDDGDGGTTLETTAGAVSTLEGAIERINTALSEAGYADVTASINATTGAIDIVDTMGRDFVVEDQTVGDRQYTTASDLGIAGSYTGGTANGERIFAGLNTRLVSSLNGGAGLAGTDGVLNFTTRDGTSDFSVDVSGLNDLNDIVNAINNATVNNAVTARVNSQGTGLEFIDNTTGSNSFTITGTGGADTAAALGISGGSTNGVITGDSLQLAYISNSTLVSELNNGNGIGTGEFIITDSYGGTATIDIDNSITTVGDLLNEINKSSNGLQVEATINANGDGITISEVVDGSPGAGQIRIEDLDGNSAERLGIAGEATGTGDDNFITGSEETVLTFEPTATLEDIRNAIDAANIGVTASIINTGTGASPFRLNLSSENSGQAGRFLIDTGGFDLGLDVLDEGNDARVFFGSSDPASGVLLTSSTNTLDGVVEGVSINLKTTSDELVQLTVARDLEQVETQITEFVDAFNRVVEGIDFQTRFDQETEERGTLLGDGTMLNLRNSLFSALRRENDGFTDSINNLTEVGITVGSDSKLEFDAEKFREAYNEDPAAVEALFTRRTLEASDDDDLNADDEIGFSELGVIVQLEEFADDYVSSVGGVLQNRRNAFDTQIQLQEDRIEAIQASLDRERQTLQAQFLAMEQAIASFQSQGSSLAQIAALG